LILRVQVWVTYFANGGVNMTRREQKRMQQSARMYMAVNVLMCFVVGCGLFFWWGKIYGASLCVM